MASGSDDLEAPRIESEFAELRTVLEMLLSWKRADPERSPIDLILERMHRLALALDLDERLCEVRDQLEEAADLDEEAGNDEAAAQKVDQAVELSRVLATRTPGVASQGRLIAGLETLARLHEANGELDAACTAIDERRRLQAEDDASRGESKTVGWLAADLARISRRAQSMGRHALALEKLREWARIFRAEQGEISPDLWSDADVARLHDIGRLELEQGNVDAALAAHLELLGAVRLRAECADSSRRLEALATSLACIARVEAGRGDSQSAFARIRECVDLRRTIASRPDSVRVQAAWALNLALGQAASLEEARGSHAAALAMLQECVDSSESMLALYDSQQYLAISVYWTQRAESCRIAAGDPLTAQGRLDDRKRLVTRLEEQCDEEAALLDVCASFWETAATAAAAAGDPQGAELDSIKAAALRAHIAGLPPARGKCWLDSFRLLPKRSQAS